MTVGRFDKMIPPLASVGSVMGERDASALANVPKGSLCHVPGQA